MLQILGVSEAPLQLSFSPQSVLVLPAGVRVSPSCLGTLLGFRASGRGWHKLTDLSPPSTEQVWSEWILVCPFYTDSFIPGLETLKTHTVCRDDRHLGFVPSQ